MAFSDLRPMISAGHSPGSHMSLPVEPFHSHVCHFHVHTRLLCAALYLSSPPHTAAPDLARKMWSPKQTGFNFYFQGFPTGRLLLWPREREMGNGGWRT